MKSKTEEAYEAFTALIAHEGAKPLTLVYLGCSENTAWQRCVDAMEQDGLC